MNLPEGLLYAVEDGVATITLSRPHEGNALTWDMHRGLRELWRRVDDDRDVQVVIVTGAGERHFCTGASVSALKTGEADALQHGTFQEVNHLSPHQNKVWKPVICCVNGLVAGGGFHFVVDSDIVVASAKASFMDPHTSVGQVGALENIGIARRSTLGTALLLTLAGRNYRMTAERAFQVGLVDLLEPDAPSAMARARELAKAIAANSPNALRLSKQAIWGALESGYERSLEHGWNLLRLQWSHPDFEEGPRAFMERRQPAWNPDRNARR
ncbi:enoyl-CoA hydratase/isomerase (plasmid) [Azospirillum sp. B510]|uniref:enoyl-CoA hydratase/isomerase family protein n=1 Tax=Azospirillum sp. (strain B510) TaxID=137722 RepID=UPI0001C4B8C5|nr:enoyl-CoA hydratase/isomerase family protein [Azospirillum sp. B510]BAI74655.1 enoyl-CoA hydratase/isomerase [Azospirillum sp. B510]